MRVSRLLIAAALFVLVGPAVAQWAAWDYDFDEEKKPWKEIEAKIPAYPQPRNLVQVEEAAGAHRVFVDVESLSRGEDGVFRYTSVVRTIGGAVNVSFEGIRCQTREHKIYALGRSDGSWSRARDTKWKFIELRDTMPFHHMLWREFFCSALRDPHTVRQAIEMLKRGGARNTGLGG